MPRHAKVEPTGASLAVVSTNNGPRQVETVRTLEYQTTIQELSGTVRILEDRLGKMEQRAFNEETLRKENMIKLSALEHGLSSLHQTVTGQRGLLDDVNLKLIDATRMLGENQQLEELEQSVYHTIKEFQGEIQSLNNQQLASSSAILEIRDYIAQSGGFRTRDNAQIEKNFKRLADALNRMSGNIAELKGHVPSREETRALLNDLSMVPSDTPTTGRPDCHVPPVDESLLLAPAFITLPPVTRTNSIASGYVTPAQVHRNAPQNAGSAPSGQSKRRQINPRYNLHPNLHPILHPRLNRLQYKREPTYSQTPATPLRFRITTDPMTSTSRTIWQNSKTQQGAQDRPVQGNYRSSPPSWPGGLSNSTPG